MYEYFERVDNIFNAVRGLGQEVSDNEIVDKILRTLPMIYNPKVSTLEDQENLSTLTLDELYGILIAYELRIGSENLPKGEATLKILKNTKNQKPKPQPNHHEEYDEKKPTSLRSSKKDQGSTKANCLSNVLIVARLGILHPSVPIPRKIMKMKETQINHSRKRKNPFTRKDITKGKRTFTQK